jgi:nicotinamidase-related amidase
MVISAELVASEHTAVITQECQGGVVGSQAKLAALAEEAQRVAIPNIARLLPAARAAGVHVAHCLAHRRPDGQGASANAKLFRASEKLELAPGTPGGSVLPELGPEPSDLLLTRLHGIGPWSGSELDILLRNLDVRTVVAVGVSVNIGVTNLVMDAVNAGYHVVVPRDAVAGVPTEYADAVIGNTLMLISTVTSTADLLNLWSNTAVAS